MQKIIDVEHKGMSDITLPFLDNEKRFFVRQQLFDNDAIVLKDVKSKTLSLKSLNHNKSTKTLALILFLWYNTSVITHAL